jgi:hypothetical protein
MFLHSLCSLQLCAMKFSYVISHVKMKLAFFSQTVSASIIRGWSDDRHGHRLYLYPQNILSAVALWTAKGTVGIVSWCQLVSCPRTDCWGNCGWNQGASHYNPHCLTWTLCHACCWFFVMVFIAGAPLFKRVGDMLPWMTYCESCIPVEVVGV